MIDFLEKQRTARHFSESQQIILVQFPKYPTDLQLYRLYWYIDMFPIYTYVSDASADDLWNLALPAEDADTLLVLFCESPKSDLSDHDLKEIQIML